MIMLIIPKATTLPSIHHVLRSMVSSFFFTHFMSVSRAVTLSARSVGLFFLGSLAASSAV